MATVIVVTDEHCIAMQSTNNAQYAWTRNQTMVLHSQNPKPGWSKAALV